LLRGSFADDNDATDKILLLAEVAGAAMLGYATQILAPKAVILKGITAENGKSQILDMVRGLLPPEAVSAVPISKFSDDRHAVSLVGKYLNASDELTSAAAVASDAFKSIITGEPVSARDVYKPATTFRPVAQHIFATNDLPSFRGGMDRGVQRRLLVITFNRTVPEKERIERIGHRIATEETELLLDWAVQGASRLIKQRSFTEPSSSKAALRDWLVGSDPVLAWLEQAAIIDTSTNPPPKIRTRDAHFDCKKWAEEEGFSVSRIPSINAFTGRVRAEGAARGITYSRASDGPYFHGPVLPDSSSSFDAGYSIRQHRI
jgi:P4 family phage/plasmid primase-like protien